MPDKSFPYVSVVIPVRNGERLIAHCLTSLLNQDYPKDRLELIVVDNNSTDGSRSIIRRFPVRYVFEETRGAAAARNAGGRVARGDFLAFIDSDCVAPPNWVRCLVEALKETGADACGGDYAVLPPGSFIEDYTAFRGVYSQREFFSGSHPFPPWLLTGNLLVRRAAFEKVRGFEEALFLAAEDIDFSWKIVQAGGRLVHCTLTKVFHRGSPSLAHFYSKNFRAGMAALLLNRRYESAFSQGKEKPFEFSEGILNLFRKLGAYFDTLFFSENRLSFHRKWGYFFLICTGHLSFQTGKWLGRIRYDVMKRPLPLPVFQRQPALFNPPLQPTAV